MSSNSTRGVFIWKILIIISLLIPSASLLASGSEVTISKEGKVMVSDAKVMQKAGPTLYTRLYWGDAYVRLLVKGGVNTKVLRSTGEAATLTEINEGDLLTMEGELESGGTSLVLLPTLIKNSSDQKKQMVLSGTVLSVDNTSNSNVVIMTAKYGAITALISTTTQIIRGTRVVTIAQIKPKDVVKQVAGSLNLGTRQMETSGLLIYLDPNLFVPKLYTATLTSITGSSTPTLTVSSLGTTYTLVTNTKTTFLNKNKQSVNISRFVTGDTLRIWGALREGEEGIIDTEVVRNMNL